MKTNVRPGFILSVSLLCAAATSPLMISNATAGPPQPANKGLVGVGRVPAAAFDTLGDKVDTLGGFFSSMSVDPASFSETAGVITGTIYGLTDRGWSLGGGAVTFDYHPRIQRFSISIRPHYEATPAAQDQIQLVNTASTVLTYDSGTAFTGADSGALPAPAVPTSSVAGPGQGRRSLDSEGLARSADGGWFVSDEYGPLLHQFNPAGELLRSFLPPEAYIPRTGNYPGTLNWTGTGAPANGRRNNRGLEGVTVTPDGKRLVSILQSPLVQDGGRAANSQNSRILELDIEAGSPTYGQAVAEYVYPLTLKGSAANDRQTIVSEILALSRERFLVIERDALGIGSGDTNTPVYKRIVLIDTSRATNIVNTGYDLERGAPGMLALPNAAWAAGTAAVAREDLVDLIQESEISRYGLNNLAKDDNSIPEKWEGMGLVALKDPENPADYLLLVGTDNDLNAPVVYHNGIPLATNAVPIDTLITAWRVTLPGVGDTAHANAQPTIAIVSPSSPTLSAPARVDLVASAYDQDGRIVKVEFFEGDVKLGEDTTFPFSLRLEGVAGGTHTYRVVGRDNDGAIAEHSRSVEVTPVNLPPVASISSPAQGGYAASGAAVKITTQAGDPDGYLASVEFLDGSTSLGVVSKAPFELSWTSPGVGSHVLSVVATDNQGATTQSAPVTLHVLPGKVVSPQATVAGAAFPAWSARWWQWAISLPFNDSHPLRDEQGDEVHRGQNGPVWFLGGAVNASGVVSRKVMLPAGKYLYFPLVNAECSSVEAPPYAGGDTQVTLNACARKFQKSDLFCSVDGIAVPGLEGNRVLSPVFTFNAPQPNLLGVDGPIQGTAVDDGYYVMLEPLAPGEHTLRFGGRFGYTDADPSLSFSFVQNITYQIIVPPAGVPFITRLEQGAGGWLLTFWGDEGLSFSVESATEVAGPYSTEGAAVQGVGGLQTVSLTGESARRFLRIRKNP